MRDQGLAYRSAATPDERRAQAQLAASGYQGLLSAALRKSCCAKRNRMRRNALPLPAIFHVKRSFELLEHEKGVLDFRSPSLDVAIGERGDSLFQIVDQE